MILLLLCSRAFIKILLIFFLVTAVSEALPLKIPLGGSSFLLFRGRHRSCNCLARLMVPGFIIPFFYSGQGQALMVLGVPFQLRIFCDFIILIIATASRFLSLGCWCKFGVWFSSRLVFLVSDRNPRLWRYFFPPQKMTIP